MYWVVLSITFLISLLGIQFIRDKIAKRWPRLSYLRLDVLLLILIFVAFAIAAYEHYQSERQIAHNERQIAYLRGAVVSASATADLVLVWSVQPEWSPDLTGDISGVLFARGTSPLLFIQSNRVDINSISVRLYIVRPTSGVARGES